MGRRRALIDEANYWIKKTAMPGWERVAKEVPGIFFRMKIRFHGTVGMITHAGMNLYNPAEWSIYWPKFIEQFKSVGWHDKGAYHEMMMQDLQRDPNYITARRAGLANDASRGKDDYETAFSFGSKLFKDIDAWGSRGFDVLKTYRQARFNAEWNRLPKEMQTKDYAVALANAINHSTGYSKAALPKVSSTVFFAPKMEVSRWSFLLGDTVKTGKTFVNWNNASEVEKASAVADIKRKALISGTYIGLLTANQGMLTASGSKQNVNFTDPRKPDWLAFKGAGYQFSTVAPLLGSIRYMINVFHAAFLQRNKNEGKDSRFEEITALTGKYVRGKLSPFAADVTEVAMGSDYQQRPLPAPIGRDKVPAYLARQGVKPYTYKEYLSEQVLPIPAQDAIKEVWKDQGMSNERIDHWLGVFSQMAVEGLTGARMNPDIEEPTEKKGGKQKKSYQPPEGFTARNINTSYR